MIHALDDEKKIKRRKDALYMAGYTQTMIAERLNVSKNAVSLVIRGGIRSRRIEQAIADACGVPRRRLFTLTKQEVRDGRSRDKRNGNHTG